jgi:hypothetical protein
VRREDVRRACCTAAVFTIAVASLSADYKESFRRAIQARDQRRWSQAVPLFREAIAERPSETGEQIPISGFGYLVPYLPHYFLGQALAASGDCSAALAELQVSIAQGAVQRTREFGALQKTVTDCEKKVPKAPTPPPVSTPPARPNPNPPPPVAPNPALAPALQQAQDAVSKAAGSERAVADLSADALLAPVWRNDARLGQAETRAKDLLASARTALDEARRTSDPKRAGEAADAATRAGQQLESVREAATARREELRTSTVELTPRGNTPPASAPPAPTSATPVKPPDAVRPPPPDVLVSAARLFFNAQYADAASRLASARFDRESEELQARLFRAAANYAVYLTGGERDTARLDAARRDVRACRALDAEFRPDAEIFSPRFLEFYGRTR